MALCCCCYCGIVKRSETRNKEYGIARFENTVDKLLNNLHLMATDMFEIYSALTYKTTPFKFHRND